MGKHKFTNDLANYKDKIMCFTSLGKMQFMNNNQNNSLILYPNQHGIPHKVRVVYEKELMQYRFYDSLNEQIYLKTNKNDLLDNMGK